MNLLVRSTLMLLSICLLTTASFSQRKYLFENFTSREGISQNSCYSIAQDGDGMMWFGTQDGLNRYDGRSFKLFLPQNSDGAELRSNYISSLHFSKSSNLLWIGTIAGTSIYDVRKDSLTLVTKRYSSADGPAKADIKKIIANGQDEVWFVTYSFGLQVLNTRNNTTVTYFAEDEYRKKVTGLVVYQGQIIASIQNKLMILNRSVGKFQPLLSNIDFPEIRELFVYRDKLIAGTLTSGCFIIHDPLAKNLTIQHILRQLGGFGSFNIDGEGNLWAGTRGNGIIILDSMLKEVSQLSNDPFNKQTLGKNFVLSSYTDKQGIVWVGLSGGGVAKYDPDNFKFTSLQYEKGNSSSLPDNMVFTIKESSNGLIYVGTQTQGIASWDTKTNTFSVIRETFKYGNNINTIYDITEDKKGNLWVASWGGLISISQTRKEVKYFTSPTELTSSKLYGICKLKNADSLFIAGENGFTFFSLKDYTWRPFNDDTFATNYIGRHIYEDDQNQIWICTIGQGLLCYNYTTQSLTIKQSVKRKSNYVRHLLRDNNVFWLSTDNGLLKYDFIHDTVLHQILPGKNLQSNVCYAAEKDDRGHLWVSSNLGLHLVNPQQFTTKHYDTDNGLTFPEYNTACVKKLADGRLVFGGVGGLTLFHPADFKENTYSPAPVITGIAINDSAWRPELSIMNTKQIRLSHLQNFLTISFAVANFSNSGKQTFKYRLKGLTDQWTESSRLNFASYTQLKPGKYSFEILSANKDGIWSSSTTSLDILISPPWWQQNWFYAALVSLFFVLLYFFFKIRIRQIKHEATLKQKILESEMRALRVQMNPHFIFNSLNSINSFIIQNKTHLASDYITKFSKLIRLILDNSTNERITLDKEIETLQLYLLMESLRFSNKFNYHINVAKGIDTSGVKIPPMLIQPFVENAIWHGLLHLEKPGEVNISIFENAQYLEVTVEDNGVGRKRAAAYKSKESNNRKSYGIQTTQDRLAAISTLNKIRIYDQFNEAGEVAGTIEPYTSQKHHRKHTQIQKHEGYTH